MTNVFDMTDPALGLPALASLLLGLACLVTALIQLRRGRRVRAGMRGVLAAGLFGLTAVLVLAGLNFHTYQRLTYERPLAELHFSQQGSQRYQVRLRLADRQRELTYRINGDEWQLDARVLRWLPPANLLGLDSRYRLERLSGRYSNAAEQRERPQSVHDLVDERGMELWPLLGKLQEYTGWIDTYYGSATYLPMADSAEYEVVMTQSGLVARPSNAEARLAVRNW